MHLARHALQPVHYANDFRGSTAQIPHGSIHTSTDRDRLDRTATPDIGLGRDCGYAGLKLGLSQFET